MCCNRESTEQVLKLLEMVFTGDLNGGMTPLIRELKIRVA